MHCRTVAAVNSGEFPATTTIFHDARPPGRHLHCELLAGHDGSHVALVAAACGGDQWWWLRWEGLLDGTAEVVQIDPCEAQLPQGRYADDCFLPDGHPGPHSFDLPPQPSRLDEHDPGMTYWRQARRHDEDDFSRQ
jgi:hypothetical protein